MSSLLQEPPQCNEDERDQIESALNTRPRTDCPDLRACLPPVHWLDCQIAEHRCRGAEGASGSFHELVVTALQDLQIELKRARCQTARDLIARGGQPYREIDLDQIAVPDAPRATVLAGLLDDEAQYYLDLGTDLGRLAAWAILQHSEGAEYHLAQSVSEYFEAEAEELAWIDSHEPEHEHPLW
jgi:hypothetical protein